jgi:hypothetical protein
MDLLSREKLTSLTEYKNDICVSLYMPALRTNPEKQQNPIRYKNLFRKAEDILFERGSRAEQVEKVLNPGRSLISDDLFWSFLQSDGFCAFLSAGDISYFRLPVHFKESVTVSDGYYLKPLLGFLHNDSRFFLLAAGLGSVKLYQCTRHSINEIPLENTPANYKEATKYDHIEKELEFHTRAITSNGQGGGEDGKRPEIMEYFKMIAHGVSNVICHDNVPLLFAGLEEHFGMFRKANTYSFLMEDNHLAYDPERLKPAQLHSRAAQIMEKHFVMTRDRAIGSYLDRTGTGHTASDIETILAAAFGGRVETLFISTDSAIWGTFDPGSLEISVHDNPGPDDRDLMDLACIYTYSKGGAVHEIASRDSGIKPPAAIFRY